MKPLTKPLLATTLALMLPLGAAAQDEAGHGTAREREALHRVQAALRQSQEQASTLAKEKAELSAQRDQLGDAAKKTQAQLASARAEGQRQQADLAAAQQALAAATAQEQAEKQDAQTQIETLTQRLQQATQTADQRARANAALVALLEHATQALTSAEKANRDMHALGLQMIETIRGGGAGAGVKDPVLGFGQVRLENQAEALRDQLDAAKLKSGAK
jgi:chromosome segregation ATPase